MTSVQTAPGLPLPSHRSRFLVSASSLRLPAPPSSTTTTPSTSSEQAYTSRRKRFSPISVTHTSIQGGGPHTHIVSLGTVDLAAVLRHAAQTRTAPELARARTPEPEEPEPVVAKDTRERPRYRVPTSPLRPTKALPSAPRPAPISIVRPRAQFPLYLPILDSRVPPIVLPSLESLEAAQAQSTTPTIQEPGRRSGRARRPASRTLEYTSDPAQVPARKRRAEVSIDKREVRTSKRARKDVNYVIPSLASIDREIAGETRPRRRRRSETSASLSEIEKEDSVDDEKRKRKQA